MLYFIIACFVVFLLLFIVIVSSAIDYCCNAPVSSGPCTKNLYTSNFIPWGDDTAKVYANVDGAIHEFWSKNMVPVSRDRGIETIDFLFSGVRFEKAQGSVVQKSPVWVDYMRSIYVPKRKVDEVALLKTGGAKDSMKSINKNRLTITRNVHHGSKEILSMKWG